MHIWGEVWICADYNYWMMIITSEQYVHIDLSSIYLLISICLLIEYLCAICIQSHLKSFSQSNCEKFIFQFFCSCTSLIQSNCVYFSCWLTSTWIFLHALSWDEWWHMHAILETMHEFNTNMYIHITWLSLILPWWLHAVNFI